MCMHASTHALTSHRMHIILESIKNLEYRSCIKLNISLICVLTVLELFCSRAYKYLRTEKLYTVMQTLMVLLTEFMNVNVSIF